MEGQNPLPQPAGHAAVDAAQDTSTLLTYIQFFLHQYSQVIFYWAVLNPFIPQPALVPVIVPAPEQDLVFSLVELHEVKVTLVVDLAKQLLILA